MCAKKQKTDSVIDTGIEREELKEGNPVLFELSDEKSLFIVKHNGEVCACGNSCPHHGAPLTKGSFKNGIIKCPWHNAEFDVVTGKVLHPPARDSIPVYDVIGKEGSIKIGDEHRDHISMPSGKDVREVLILGAGAAGTMAAETLRKEGFSGNITLISKEKELPYDRTTLSKEFLSGEIPEKFLSLRDRGFYDSLHITLRLGEKVVSLDEKNKIIFFEGGNSVKGDTAILIVDSA